MGPGPAPRAVCLARERRRRRAPGAGPVRAGIDRSPEVPGSPGDQSDRHPRHRDAAGADEGARLGRRGRGRRHHPGAALRLGHLRGPALWPRPRRRRSRRGVVGAQWSGVNHHRGAPVAPPARRDLHHPSQRRPHRPALRLPPGAALRPALRARGTPSAPWASPASSTSCTRSTTSSTCCAAPPRQPWWSSSRRRSRHEGLGVRTPGRGRRRHPPVVAHHDERAQRDRAPLTRPPCRSGPSGGGVRPPWRWSCGGAPSPTTSPRSAA